MTKDAAEPLNWNREHIADLMQKIRSAATESEADAIVEAEAERTLSRYPWVGIEGFRKSTRQTIGYMAGTLERVETDRILDLFRTEHPWRDRDGNILPKMRR